MLQFIYQGEIGRAKFLMMEEGVGHIRYKPDFWASMYACAEYFGVPTLKQKTQQCFVNSLRRRDDWQLEFIIQNVYGNTPKGVRGLRDALVGMAIERETFLLESSPPGLNAELLVRNPEFSADLSLAALKKTRRQSSED